MAKKNQKNPPNRGPNRRDEFTDQSPVGGRERTTKNTVHVHYTSDGKTALKGTPPAEGSSSPLIR